MQDITPFLKYTRSAYIPLRLRKKIVKFFKLRPQEQEFKIKTFGAQYAGRTGHHMDDKIFIYGAHEPATINLIRNILRHDKEAGYKTMYLDAGTNCGFHLVCAAGLADKALGFEPWDFVHAKAQANINANNYGHAKVMNCALSDESGQASFAFPVGKNLGVGTLAIDECIGEYGEDDAGISRQKTKKVTVKRADDVIGDCKDYKVSVIKIDTEGVEVKVLGGLSKTLVSHRPAVIFESSAVSKKDFDTYQNLQSLFPKNYSFWGILPSRARPKLVRYKTGKRFENILAWPDVTVPKTLTKK